MKTVSRFLSLTALLAGAASAGCAMDPDPDVAAQSAAVIAQQRPDGTMGYYKHVCAGSPGPGAAVCHALAATDAQGRNVIAATRPDGSPDGLHPDEVQRAYAIPSWGGAGQTVAIVDAFDNPNAEADLQVYRTKFGLPACTTANGCFRKVNQDGKATPLPSGNFDWGQEIALDLDAVSAACPSCKILLVEATTNSYANFEIAEKTAANLGAVAISNSWGGDEFSTEAASSSKWNFPGVGVFFSTGDDGFGLEYPSVSQYVTAVGGTTLTQAADAARGWREAAWAGAGSGCSQYIAKPSWQHDTSCSNRSVSDVSAVANPSTGLAIYNTYLDVGWSVFGGTSLSTPLVAAIYTTAGVPGAGPSLSYGGADAYFDVTTGSNGSCGNYLCIAGIGYDGPTGNGSPGGTLFLNPPDPNRVAGGGVTGDFDGDGKADVMVLYDNGNASAALWVFPGTTGQVDGATAPYRVWYAPGPNAFDANRAKVSAGDFDGDGKTDVLMLYDYGSGSAGLFVIPGVAGHFQGATQPFRVWNPGPGNFEVSRAKISAGDFDHDGKADLLALYDYGNASAGLFVFPGTTGRTDGSSNPYRIWFAPGPNAFNVNNVKVSAGDFNGDGKADMLALYDYGGSTAGLFVFPGVASHVEGASQPARVWFVQGPNAFDVWRTKVSAGDFDGDGKADLLALYDYGSASAGLFVFPGTTGKVDGSSVPYRVWNPGPGSFDVGRARITAGDFDHNGKADVMALYDYGSGSAGLFVFPGTTGKVDGASNPYRVWNPGPGSFDGRLSRVP